MANYYHAMNSDGIQITVSDGNSKLISNEDTRFIIWSITSVRTCPYATPECIRNCYAFKAERMYPSCKTSRERNYEASHADDFVEVMCNLIRRIMKRSRNFKKSKKVYFRIHESGDFYSREYLGKWLLIMSIIGAEFPQIVFAAYTKSIPYFFNGSALREDIPENFVVSASVWDDTKEDLKKLSFEFFKVYTAYTAEKVDALVRSGNGWTKCRCSDCARCSKCYTKNEKMRYTACVIH